MANEQKQPDWERLRYPSSRAFERVLRDFPNDVHDGKDYVAFHALPGWIRLGWPTKALWDRAARTEQIDEATAQRAAGQKVRIPTPWAVSRVEWSELVRAYPDRDGVPAHEQDLVRLLTYWPDCYGQTMIDVELAVPNITINDLHFGRGRHRVPSSVAAVLRETDRRAREEVLKAVMPKSHPDRVMVISALTGNPA